MSKFIIPMVVATAQAKAARRSCYFLTRSLVLVALLGSLPACNALDRLSEVGEAPKLAAVQDPSHLSGPNPVNMPMPPPSLNESRPNSLWQTGSRAFLRDQRASRVGDILTVVITINDQAQLQNETKRERQNTEGANLNNLFGYEAGLKNIFPNEVAPDNLVSMGSNTSNDGKGSINRQEQIKLRVAATITQILPNGNLVLAGKQQVMVNYDMRELLVSGVIRPSDISSDNTVNYDQIAEARIAYGGRGTIQDIQQPRYGTQVMDILMPF